MSIIIDTILRMVPCMEMRTSTLFACAAGNENQPKGHFSSEKKKHASMRKHIARARAQRVFY